MIIMADSRAMLWFLFNEMFNINAIEQEIQAMGEEADDALMAAFILLNTARDRYRRQNRKKKKANTKTSSPITFQMISGNTSVWQKKASTYLKVYLGHVQKYRRAKWVDEENLLKNTGNKY